MLKGFLNLLIMLIIIPANQSGTYCQVDRPNLEKLSKTADLILVGKVSGQKSSWNDSGTRIYTDASIQVEETVKGGNGETSVVVSFPGGEVDDVGELYSHMPRFVNDEEVLLFLKKNLHDSKYSVVDGEQGKVSVLNDPLTGEKITSSNIQVKKLKDQIRNYISGE